MKARCFYLVKNEVCVRFRVEAEKVITTWLAGRLQFSRAEYDLAGARAAYRQLKAQGFKLGRNREAVM